VPPRPQARPFNGAIVFAVGDDGKLTEVGRVTHDAHATTTDGAFSYAVMRSIVIGDALYTLSDGGVLRSDLTTLADEGFAAFPVPDYSKGQPIPIEG
jgi:hypothetical protein